MPIDHLTNGLTEIRQRDGTLVMLLPTQVFTDLRSKALIDGLREAEDERWLLGEVRYAGEPALAADPQIGAVQGCWNCGGTLGFYAPTGERDPSRHHYRPDVLGGPSPLRRRWEFYPCPACQNPIARLIEDLYRIGILAPQLVLNRAEDIWWDKPGREAMGLGVQAFIARMQREQSGGLLTLVGPFGCGKTVLAEHIVLECHRARRDVLYVTADRFKQAVHETFDEADRGGDYLRRVRSAGIVVMDQIDWIRETTSGGQAAYAAEVFRDVFNHRYALRETHATVWVVNLDAWERQGDSVLAAIYNRMNEGQVLIARGKGVRQEIADPVRVYGQASYEPDPAVVE